MNLMRPMLLVGVALITTIGFAQTPPTVDNSGIKARARLKGLDNWIESVAYSPDGNLFASETADHSTTVFNIKTGSPITVIKNTGPGLAFSPDSSILAVCSASHSLELHDSHTGNVIRTLPAQGPFAFSPDGMILAAVSPNTITLFDVQTGGGRLSFRDNCAEVYSVAFSPDGSTIATGNVDSLVRLFDTATGRQKLMLQGNTERVLQVAFSPDGALVASGGKDGTIHFWDPITGQSKGVVHGHSRGVNALAFSPDGTKLASGGADYYVKLWNVSDLHRIDILIPPKATVTSLAFSPDSTSLAVGQWGVTVWANAGSKSVPSDPGPPIDLPLPGSRPLDNEGPAASGVPISAVKPGRKYFLVGAHHVFEIGPDGSLHQTERKEIEQTYADGVAADQAAYQTRVDLGGVAAQQAKYRDADIETLSQERDQSLGSLYKLRDDLRDSHPEFKIADVDGPYQVVAVDYEIGNENEPIFDDFEVDEPWPGYAFTGTPFGGWSYGVVYRPQVFIATYVSWRSAYARPRYINGFVGHHGRVIFINGRVAGHVSDYATRTSYSQRFLSAQQHAAAARAGAAGRARVSSGVMVRRVGNPAISRVSASQARRYSPPARSWHPTPPPSRRRR